MPSSHAFRRFESSGVVLSAKSKRLQTIDKIEKRKYQAEGVGVWMANRIMEENNISPADEPMESQRNKPAKSTIFYITICAAVLIIGYWLALAIRTDFGRDSRQMADAANALVYLYRYDAQGTKLSDGMGFLALAPGMIVTNYQTLEQAYYLYAASSQGELFTVNAVAAYDAAYDVAILISSDLYLQDEATWAPRPTANNKKVAVGDSFTLLSPTSQGTVEISFPLVKERIATETEWPLWQLTGENAGQFGVLFDDQGRIAGWLSAYWTKKKNAVVAVDIGIAKSLYEKRNYYDDMTLATFQQQFQP